MNVPALRTLALAAALAAALSACESPSKISQPSTPAVETRTPLATAPATTAPAATVSTNPTPAQSSVAAVDLATPRSATPGAGAAGAAGSTALMAAPTERVVYFDFDSFAIKDEYKGLLDAHAKVLARTASKRIVVEGHTDERGGREYNLALGQKRAEAVVRSLALLGVSDKQMEAVSFGQERPAVQGADESAWSRNRRAELKDK